MKIHLGTFASLTAALSITRLKFEKLIVDWRDEHPKSGIDVSYIDDCYAEIQFSDECWESIFTLTFDWEAIKEIKEIEDSFKRIMAQAADRLKKEIQKEFESKMLKEVL